MTAPPPPVDLNQLETALAAATPGVWKLWGMDVLADQDGTSNVDTAVPVAHTTYRDEDGKPRTFDASLICALRNAAPDLIAELRALRAESEKRLDALIKVRAERDTLRATVAAVEALRRELSESARTPEEYVADRLRAILGSGS